MVDKETENNVDILLLGDFNIKLFKQLHVWDDIISLFGHDQIVQEATRVTESCATLTDHIYTRNKSRASVVKIVESSISGHFAISCHWSI